MYYAAINSYSTDTSVGFANTWAVIGFATKAMRDAYVERATDLATRAIKAAEIREYDGKPGQVPHYDQEGSFFQYYAGEFFRTGAAIDPSTAAPIADGIWTHA